MHTLSGWETFEYGVIGASTALLAIQALPVFRALASGETQLRLGPGPVCGALGFILAYLLCGGVAAIVVGDATLPKHAIAYGLGWQAIIAGYMRNPFSRG